jgi:hypothetical protein
MRVICTSKGMSKKVWGARYALGARYRSKNTVVCVWQFGTVCPLSVRVMLQEIMNEWLM